jgi:type II secretory pathway pseudopilin PulG
MCEPTTIASGVIALAGTAAAMKQQQTVNKARNKTQQAEFARQAEYERAARKHSDDSADVFTLPEQTERKADIANTRTAKLQGNITGEGTYQAPTAGSAPKVVKTQLAKSIHDALESGRTRAASLGQLGAWGDLAQMNQIDLSRNRSKIDSLGGFSAGSAGVVPMELAGDNQEGVGFGYAADGLKAVGHGVNAYGAHNNVSWDDIFSASKSMSPTSGPYGKNGLRPY